MLFTQLFQPELFTILLLLLLGYLKRHNIFDVACTSLQHPFVISIALNRSMSMVLLMIMTL